MQRKTSFIILFLIFCCVVKSYALPNILKFDNNRILPLKDQSPDVGVISILVPGDTVDSNSIITPVAEVKNFGDITVSFPILFWDSTFSFYDIQLVMDLPPESTRSIQFNNWQVTLTKGVYVVKCSTALSNDVNNLNDLFEKQILCRVKDIAVTNLLKPDTINFGDTVIPGAVVKNLGNTQAGFLAIFNISTVYTCSSAVSLLSPGSETTLIFSPWISNVFGTHVTSCTTVTPGDMNQVNNKLTDSVRVRTKDFGISEILAPLQVIPPTGQLNPKVLVTNFGNLPATGKVYFIIKDTINQISYKDSSVITLNPQISDSVTFSSWVVDSGVHEAVTYTSLEGDVNPSNDTMILDFVAGTPNIDVGVVSIIYPLDTILRMPITPKAVIKNFGYMTETFNTYFEIRTLSNPLYFDSILISNLRPNTTIELAFPIWNPPIGTFSIKCFTALEGDVKSENDTLSGSVTVETLAISWVSRASLPNGPSSKPKKVKSGGTLVYAPPTTIYAFKGNNTNEFYCYDMATNKWTAKETIPWVGKKKRVKTGACLCSDNQNYLYALKGNGTTEFWRYSIQSDSWSTLAYVPVTGDKPKKIKSGAGLAYATISDTQHFIYLLKGSNTFEFYAYWVEKDTWLTKHGAPEGPKGKQFKAGSCIAYDYHHQCLWTLKGGTNEFYAYDMRTDAWSDKPGIGLKGKSGKKKKVKDGAGIAYSTATNLVYALKGGNTYEFWRYVPGDTWFQMENDFPSPNGEKGVKDGGSLIFANGNLYALRGNKTNDFYVYNFGSSVGIEEPKEHPITQMLNKLNLKIQPNPISNLAQISYSLPGSGGSKVPVILKLYNTTGQIEKVLLRNSSPPGYYNFGINLTQIPNGVYIVQLIAGEQKLSRKVLIIKK